MGKAYRRWLSASWFGVPETKIDSDGGNGNGQLYEVNKINDAEHRQFSPSRLLESESGALLESSFASSRGQGAGLGRRASCCSWTAPGRDRH
jgi:hypothetical protein